MSLIHRPCDLCFSRGGRFVESDFVDIKLKINDERGTLDLCEPHYEQLLMPVIEAVADRKEDDLVVRRKTTRKQGPYRCAVPDCPTPTLKHIDSFWQHTQRIHHITLTEYREKYGEPQVITPEEAAEIVVEAPCPVPGCGAVYSTELGHRWPHGALTSHLRGRHALRADGVTPVSRG